MMVVVSYTTLGGGLISKDKRELRRFWWLERSAVAKKRTLYRRDELQTLPSYSQLNEAADAWNLLSDEEKSNWNLAGFVCGLHGYNLFIQDKVYRLMNEISGNADPSVYHQYLVGHLEIPESAGNVLLRQSGTAPLNFPADLFLNRKCALSGDPANGEWVKLRFKYTYDESGGEQTQTDEITLPLSDGWNEQSLGLTPHDGVLGPWLLEIETNALKGDLWFDDIWVEFAGGLIGNDPLCTNVVKYWSKIDFPDSAVLETIYPTGGAL